MLGKNITKFQLRFTFKFKFLKVSFGYSIISFFKHKFLMENFLRNHPYIMSAKGLGGLGQKNGNFADVQYYVGWVGQKKSKNTLT